MKELKNVIVAVALLWAAGSVFAQAPAASGVDMELYRQATDLFRKEKYASAQFLFDKVAKGQPDFAGTEVSDACYYSAVCSEELNNSDAEYRLEEFMRLYPQSSKLSMARFYLGNFYYQRGDYTKAQREYLMLDPADVEYGHRNEYDFKVGYCYFSNDDLDHAKNYFQRVINSKSKYRNSATYYYAHILYTNHDYQTALTYFKKLEKDRHFAKIVPSYEARIYYFLGREDDLLKMAPDLLARGDVFKRSEIEQMVGEVYFRRGEYERAIDYYRKADLSEEKENGGAGKKNVAVCNPQDNFYQRGYCYYMLGKYDSAEVFLARKTACNDSVAQNALYTLGDTYVKLGRKSDARSMFLQASQLDYDRNIKEDALFNYAKLSCELNQNAYNESIKSFENYLKQYPKTKHKEEIQEILTSLYFTTRNYKDALTLIEKIPNKSAEMNLAYQRIVLNRGIELFNERNVQDAASYFSKAIKINASPKTTCDAYYLFGEAKYRLDEFGASAKSLDKFFLSSNATTSPYYTQALYTQGYISMKQERYGSAIENFRKFISKADRKQDKNQIIDAHNRMGDCYYMQKAFETAIEQYDYVITANGADADYATYQKALAYGALGKNAEKLNNLNYIFERYKRSQLASKAMLEIANTYLVCDNNEMALLYYNNFVKQYPKSAYVKEALLSMGLIYYNTERDSLALQCFDKLLTDYQGTDEARDALVTVKNIYIAQNRVDEYFDYAGRTTKTTISQAEQDSTIFITAENRYFENDYDNAITGFENYLKRFPRGLFSLKAHYYLADALMRSGNSEQALPHFEAVAAMGNNQYTETSLTNAARIAYGLGNYSDALDHYVELVTLSENDQSRLQSRLGILRCHSKLGNHANVIAAADMLLAEEKATDEHREEALITKARSYFDNNETDSADAVYGRLLQSVNGEYSGEAAYRKAEILFRNKDYAATEHAIEAITSNPPSDYWLAKAFILWADVFYAQGNSLQAKQTLQSIIDNYEGDDLVTEALQRRNAILAAEAEAAAALEGQDGAEITIELTGDADSQEE